MSAPDRDNDGRVSRAGLKESLAALAVILSMVFVAVEIRQNTRAIQATVRNDLATASREWTLARATSPELSEATLKWEAGEEMTRSESRMAVNSVVALLRNVENVFLQVQMGAVDASALRGYGFEMTMYGTENFARFWNSIRDQFHPDFVAAFEARNGL